MSPTSAPGVTIPTEDQTAYQQQRLEQRLRNAIERLHLAERERVQAMHAAHAAGLSLRTIAAAVGLSRSRVHQLLRQDAGSTT